MTNIRTMLRSSYIKVIHQLNGAVYFGFIQNSKHIFKAFTKSYPIRRQYIPALFLVGTKLGNVRLGGDCDLVRCRITHFHADVV